MSSELDVAPFTDQQWWKMCDAHMSLPVPLHEADLSKPFVFQRGYGVFYVPNGMHQVAMSLLLAFNHGLACGDDAAEKFGLEYSAGTADKWLEETPGAAFRSAVHSKVRAARRGNLTAIEKRFFGEVQYLMQEQQ